MDRQRLIEFLDEFLRKYELWDELSSDNWNRPTTDSIEREMLEYVEPLRRVIARVTPRAVAATEDAVRSGHVWVGLGRAAAAARGELIRGAEVDEALGPEDTPTLDAATHQPQVWAAARPFWQTGHRREAVETAAKFVNAMLQEKVHRRDLTEGDLFQQAFSKDPATTVARRLRLPPFDGGHTQLSVQAGVLNFGKGAFAAIRNPFAHDYHEPDQELPEPIALEQLAAFSLLARWIDEARGALLSPAGRALRCPADHHRLAQATASAASRRAIETGGPDEGDCLLP